MIITQRQRSRDNHFKIMKLTHKDPNSFNEQKKIIRREHEDGGGKSDRFHTKSIQNLVGPQFL